MPITCREDNIKRKELIKVINSLVVKNESLESPEIYKLVNAELKKRDVKKKYIKGGYLWPENLEIIRANYEDLYKNIDIPLLYIIGENDKFVDPISNTRLLRSFENPQISVLSFQGLNHYTTSGELNEVSVEIYDMNADVLNQISAWINDLN